MAPGPSSSTSVAVAATAVEVTDPSPSVAPSASVVALASAMGAIKVSSSIAPSGSSTSSSSMCGKSDAINSAVDQESAEPLIRSLSGSRLNAKAPEFVPKGIISPSSSGFFTNLIPVTSLPIPGLLPVQFTEAFVSTSQFEPMPTIVTLPPLVVASSATSPPFNTELEDAILAQDSSPPQTQTTVSAAPPHPKPVINEELKAKIVKQVEFYFSDQNLPTDNYLMKFVKKDPDGFVPIPVVASFRKIKNLVKNHVVVAAALRNSTVLVVSDDGKKVRRTQPLPEVDVEEVQSRTVVAENLPEDHSIESVELLFGSVGIVKMVRICRPEAANGTSQTAAKFKSDMVVSNKLHALVEFETVEQAEKAVLALTDQRNWRSGLRVRLLLRRTFQSKHGYQQASFQKGRKGGGGDESGGEDEEGAEDKTGEDFGLPNDRSEDAPGNDAAGTLDRDAASKKAKGRGRGRGMTGRGRGQHNGPHHHTGSNGSRNHQLGTSPQTSHSPIGSEVVGRPPPGPRMPDGTRGFTLGRGKVPIMGSA